MLLHQLKQSALPRHRTTAGWRGTRRKHAVATCLLLLVLGVGPQAQAENEAPDWVKQGAYVYRVSTPDETNVLPQIESGTELTSNLLDGSIAQILILNGIIGHDHPGAWNWDGVWPYWNRVTFRANHDWDALAKAMERSRRESNAYWSFHVNLTDVNVGLRDYPETRAFFDSLVEHKAIYRREFNPQTNRWDIGEPYVPQAIPSEDDHQNPVEIFALVNYQRFWESGLAKQMLDDFYQRLPYAPPVMYLDVLNLTGGNFNTGLPDGPLGGSEQSQLEGANAIIDYLRSKGTDLGTEGPRPEFGDRAGYVWLHGKGFSDDDYRVISGGNWHLAAQQVFGGAGAFNVSPVSLTDEKLDNVRRHYEALLAGKPGTLPVAGDKTWRIAYRAGVEDKYDIPGTGDPFRGHWADLVNNFYLVTIQELYHIGRGNTRTSADLKAGVVHLGTYSLVGNGTTVSVSVPDFVTTWQGEGARRIGQIMLDVPLETKAAVTNAGRYSLRVKYKSEGRTPGRLNVYANDRLIKTVEVVPGTENNEFGELLIGDVELHAGENTIAFDSGPIRAAWSDGTTAEWTTPYLRRGFKVSNGEIVFAEDYHRMWPDSWSGQQKIYFFSWDGTERAWKLPEAWSELKQVMLYPLTPHGRDTGIKLEVQDGHVAPKLLPQVPYIIVPPAA
ncbi:MAG: glycoside hydrolase family 101 beta sandwich domain-containing protein [Pirellulales bacterium]